MKKFIPSFLLILLAVFVISCSPTADFDGDLLRGVKNQSGNTGGGTIGTNLIKRVTATATDGTVTAQDYIYNGNILTGVNIDNDGDMRTIKISYENKKITGLFVISEDNGVIVATNTILNYTNSILTGASSITTSAGDEINKSESSYTYSTLKLSKIKTVVSQKDQSGNINPFATNITDITFSGSNISAYKSTLTVAPIPGSPIQIPPVIAEANLSDYDAKRNPFATLPKEFNIVQGDAMFGTSPFLGLSGNNYGKVTAIAGGQTLSVNYTYEYNANGYPTKATSSEGTLIFEYLN